MTMDIWRFKIRAGCDSVHWRAAQDEKEVPLQDPVQVQVATRRKKWRDGDNYSISICQTGKFGTVIDSFGK